MKFLAFHRLISKNDISRMARLLVGFLFLYAGISKALNMEGFAESIMAYQLTGPYLSKIMASTLPYIEMLTGVFLLVGFKIKESLIIVTGLCVIFTAALCYAMTADLQISCGCFAVDTPPGNLMLSVVRNLGIITACLSCLTRKEWLYDNVRTY